MRVLAADPIGDEAATGELTDEAATGSPCDPAALAVSGMAIASASAATPLDRLLRNVIGLRMKERE
jgi:hypothetical protein